MRYLKIAALALVSMLTVIMAQAGNAAAALLWLVCLPGEGLTRYTSSTCLTAGGSGGTRWESRGLIGSEDPTVKILGFTITLRDSGAKSGVTCFMNGSRGEGRIKANGGGEITVGNIENAKENCRGIEGCETNGVEEVTAIDFPWGQELTEGPEGKILGIIRETTEGRPTYRIKCKVLKLPVTDTCKEEAGFPEKVELINERTTGPGGSEELLVRSRFEEVAHGECSVGGANAAKVSGLTVILLPGGAISITKV